MDTNLLQIIRELTAQRAPVMPSNSLAIVSLIVGALGPLIAAMAAYYAKRSADKVEKVVEVQDKIHEAVNSSKTILDNKVIVLDEEKVELTKKLAIAEERAARGTSPALMPPEQIAQIVAAMKASETK